MSLLWSKVFMKSSLYLFTSISFIHRFNKWKEMGMIEVISGGQVDLEEKKEKKW